jgi:hypothetical protein
LEFGGCKKNNKNVQKTQEEGPWFGQKGAPFVVFHFYFLFFSSFSPPPILFLLVLCRYYSNGGSQNHHLHHLELELLVVYLLAPIHQGGWGGLLTMISFIITVIIILGIV